MIYYPILRGRQNELLAIKELLRNDKLSKNIIPVIEPVKLSPTLIGTLSMFNEKNRSIFLVKNPQVGSFFTDAKNPKNEKYLIQLNPILEKPDLFIKHALYMVPSSTQELKKYIDYNISMRDIIPILSNPDEIDLFNQYFTSPDTKVILPFAPGFRRIKSKKIYIDDKFIKQPRNSDYSKNEDEFFSDDFLYDDYYGFSDYSVIGKEYSDSGFAPHAVAIHIVYFDKDHTLRIHHFVSDDNDDVSDTAGKLYQATTKLHNWNLNQKLDTIAIKQFEKIYEDESYPGLGIIKKLSIMHHLELIGKFLDGEEQ